MTGAVIAAVLLLCILLYALDRGIYVGSTNTILHAEQTGIPLVRKMCRYLFVTGIAEKPAHGGEFGSDPIDASVQPQDRADKLYCRVFGE